MAEVDIGTWVSTLTIIGALFALYFTLRRELRSEITGVESRLRGEIEGSSRSLRAEIEDIKTHVVRLDDRVYALAVGMRPVIDEAERRAPKH